MRFGGREVGEGVIYMYIVHVHVYVYIHIYTCACTLYMYMYMCTGVEGWFLHFLTQP